MASDGSVVLSYNDSLLRQSDVKLLSKGCWLNDNIIGFAFEYYAIERFIDHSEEITFIPPNITQFIKLGGAAEVEMFIEPLHLAEKDLVIQAVNDSTSFDTAGGSHWSLLSYHRPSNTFKHYDSMSGGNRRHAKMIAKKLFPFLKGGEELNFLDPECPQQANGSDCGVYVLCFAEELCKHRPDENQEWNITPDSIQRYREDLLKTIETLRNRKT